MKKETRLFFVVSSDKSNEELFGTLEEAKEYRLKIGTEQGSLLRIAMVKNCYYDKDAKGWNYEDYFDTFEFIKIL